MFRRQKNAPPFSRRGIFYNVEAVRREARLNARSLGCRHVFDGQLDTAAVVHVQYQYFHFLAFFQDVGHFLYASVAQHRDVNQTVLAWQDVDECAEVDDALNLADVDLADRRLQR